MTTKPESGARKRRDLTWTLLGTFAFGLAIGFSLCYALMVAPRHTRGGEPRQPIAHEPPDVQPGEPREVVEPSPIGIPSPIYAAAGDLEFNADIWAGRHLFVALEGTALDEPGRAFLRALRPGGVLLRDVNIESLPQVRGLVQQVKEAVGLGKGLSSLPLCAVLPDEGRVDRFGEADAPSPAQLGETWDAVKVREAGMVFGAACAQRGISVVFAPVLDVYEPGCAFPGIERASFGEDRDLVTAMGLAMADGLMEAGVVPVAKHYPGMGAARRPEGGGLFVIERDIPQLAELIYPFAEAVAQGIPGILVEHTAVPMLEQGPSESAHATPASMSSALIGRVLRENLHFRGVVVAGDLASKVLQGVRSAEEASVAALVAGCDALIYAEAEPKRIHAICEVIETAVREGVLTEERLAASRQLSLIHI